MPRRTTPLVALAAAAVLAGCGTHTAPAPGSAPPGAVAGPVPGVVTGAPAAAPPGEAPTTMVMVMVIRHGEKPEDDAAIGIDANGNPSDASLTRVGWDRAYRLADLFDPANGSLRPGLARPTAIYAAGENDNGRGARTRETVKPLADELGLVVNTSYGKGDEESLAKHVLAQPGPVLISWQHGEIPAIAEALPRVRPTPPSDWPDDRFDVVWTFTKTTDGWQFAQVPELVLPQDQATVIEASDN